MTPEMPAVIDGFSAQILQVLTSDASEAGVSVPRLGKALGQSASVVMRQLTLIGDVCGMGWVTVAPDGDRFMVRLTDAGRAAAEQFSKNNPDVSPA